MLDRCTYFPKLLLLLPLVVLAQENTSFQFKNYTGNSYNQHTWVTPPNPIILGNLETSPQLIVDATAPQPFAASLDAFRLPIIDGEDDLTFKLMREIKAGLRYVFQTQNPLTIALHGTGTIAMETVLANMVEPGDRVLFPIIGLWTKSAKIVVERIGGVPLVFEQPKGTVFHPSQIVECISQLRPNVVFIVMGESSSGMRQPVTGIGEACRIYGCILIVDNVHIVGFEPFFMDAWQIDVVYTNVQKGLGAPVGLSAVSFNDRALKKYEERNPSFPVVTRLNDIKTWKDLNYWQIVTENEPSMLLHSLALPLMYTLREALKHIATEGLKRRWDLTQEAHDYLRRRLLEEIPNIQFFGDPDYRLVADILFYTVPGLHSLELSNFIKKKYGIVIGHGHDVDLVGVINEISLMGRNTDLRLVEPIVDAVKDAWTHYTL